MIAIDELIALIHHHMDLVLGFSAADVLLNSSVAEESVKDAIGNTCLIILVGVHQALQVIDQQDACSEE